LKKEYWLVLLAYIIMQVSSLIGIPLVTYIGTQFGQSLPEMEQLAVPFWLVISFAVTLVLVFYILKNEWNERNQLSTGLSTIWAILGVFLAFLAQTIAANIESMMGIESGSENTKQIISIIESFPIVIFVSSIIGPILEEIIFRKIIFGSLYKRMNFYLSALLSSIIFAAAHFEPEHILLYSAMGFTFAFLYVKTNRIIVPIFAHVAMNTLVVIIQILYKEEIENIIKETDHIQSFIGGFL
jgi:uncharacterized protein